LSQQAASLYLHQLELISSPVPDLAATLTTEAHARPNDVTLSFLRARLHGGTVLPLQEQQLAGQEAEHNDQASQRDSRLTELQDFEVAMSRRIPILREDEGSRYANRVPQRQSLYDWAPGSDDEDLYHELLSRANIPTFAQSVRPPSRHLNLDSHRRSHSRSRIRPRDGSMTRPPSGTEAAQRGSSPPRADSSSSTAALLQSVEQHRRFNARARSTLQSYILERDRRNNAPVDNAPNLIRVLRPEQFPPGSPYPAVPSLSSQADLLNAQRSVFLDHPSLTRLKNSIHYLSKLRHCDTLEEGLTLATDLADGFSNLSDLIVDTASLPPIPECSWLTPGTVFSGSQHTPRDPCPVMLSRDRDRDRDRSRETLFPSARSHQDPQQALQERHRRRSYARIGTYRDRLPVPDSTIRPGTTDTDQNINHHNPHLPTLSHLSSSSSSSAVQSDHWPVKITLHDISYSKSTVSGTMSAIHIPDKLSTHSPLHNPKGSSMRSFFEGEIIDFRTHTLETENFCTREASGGDEGGLGTDARYWRGIGPFRELLEKRNTKKALLNRGKWHMPERSRDDDDDAVEDMLGGEDTISSHLRSRSWIENVLLKEWVLMRWKERCFIKSPSSEVQPGARAPGDVQSASRRYTEAQSGTGTRTAFHSSSSSSSAITDPSSWGLTISGFYYVALRRQTGEIEGLYYDPGSLPFQVLELRPEGACGIKGQWPAQEFR
jgi:Vacuolar import and degradation protein